eukprot:Em0001g3458a
MEVHGFYGRPKHIPQSSKSETDIKLERLTEAVQANADSIKGVVQQMEVMPKEIGELKTKKAPSPATPSPATTPGSSRNRIPSVLSTAVKSIYASLSDKQQFKVDERYRSSHNQQVTDWLLGQLTKSGKMEEYSEFHTRAVYRYYESRRRQFIDSHQSREEKAAANQKNSTKRRSQKKLYLKRQTVLKDEQERKKWAEIDPSYMTDESDYEKDLKKVKVTHKPVWRSNLLNRLVHKLDKRLAAKKETVEYTGFKQKERVAGLVSLSLVPNNAPAWAVDKADAAEAQSTPSPIICAPPVNVYSKSSTELVAKRTWTELSTHKDIGSSSDELVSTSHETRRPIPLCEASSDDELEFS